MAIRACRPLPAERFMMWSPALSSFRWPGCRTCWGMPPQHTACVKRTQHVRLRGVGEMRLSAARLHHSVPFVGATRL